MTPLVRALPLALLASLPLLAHAESPPADSQARQIERGRYLVQISGCNDCHTAGYLSAPDQVAERDWLKGDSLGWYGPWGTSYPSNLRLLLPKLSESEWLGLARHANYRPPMPNRTLQQMSDDDLRAIYQLVKHLGPAGEPAPPALPPGDVPSGPVVMFPMPAAKP